MPWQYVLVRAFVPARVGGGGRPDQSLPGYQPYPDQGLPGYQPYPDQGLPGFQPYPDQGLPGFRPYPDQSLPPVVNFDDMPEHPELPDLNAGNWQYVAEKYGTLKMAFVPWPLAVTHPDYNPSYPEQGTPGEWVVIVYTGRAVWAWVPSSGGDSGTSSTSTSTSGAQRTSKPASASASS